MSRAAVAFPGRGAYGPSSLGSLSATHRWIRRADELRAAAGLTPLSEVDAAPRFDAALHLRPPNAWPLTFLCSLLDAERIADDHEVVVVVASSTGWYTALVASGALDFDAAFRLVQAMALVADEPLPAGARAAELIYPLHDDAWMPDASRSEALEAAMRDAGPDATRALDLGAFAVIGGTVDALERLAAALPKVSAGGRTFPLLLPNADGWHTPLRTAQVAAAERIDDLGWERPNVTLVDGRGRRFTPLATDPAELETYTLDHHPTTGFDFARALRVALREYAPEMVLLPGPGGSLGAPCAQAIVAEGYRGLRTRDEFEAAQGGAGPILLSMRR